MSAAMARAAFRDAVALVAERAKQALPVSVNGRVEKAMALVLHGDVEPQPDGSVLVFSATDATRRYVLQGTSCTCADFERGQAPGGWCQHRVAAAIAKRVGEMMADQPYPVTVDTPPLPEAPVEAPHGIDPRYVVTIQGRPHVKFAGLLQLAHARGLASLTADWTYNCDDLSLAHAVATFQDGRRFEESADSTPANVGKKVALHWRRLSLTRAKARALRDALGCELIALEELSGEE